MVELVAQHVESLKQQAEGRKPVSLAMPLIRSLLFLL